MKRKEFLSIIGLGAAAVACTACLGGCGPLDNIPSAPTNVDFTINLNDSAYAALKSIGGYVYNGGIIIVYVSSNKYVVVSSVCTHAGSTIIYDASNSRFFCPSHGSVFALNGTVINGPASSPLATYNNSLSGNSLRVYS